VESEAKGRMTVNEDERTLVEQARHVAKLTDRRDQAVADLAALNSQLVTEQAKLRGMLPPPAEASGLRPAGSSGD
jgi:hypothetical protein